MSLLLAYVVGQVGYHFEEREVAVTSTNHNQAFFKFAEKRSMTGQFPALAQVNNDNSHLSYFLVTYVL